MVKKGFIYFKHLDFFKHLEFWILIGIFLVYVFLRFYDLENRTPFGWDQVTNAWVVKGLLVDHRFPLIGPVAKLNSGIYVGPLYYYYLAIFYFITHLDPIAAGWSSACASIFTFITLFYVTRKIFSINVAVIAVLIHTVSHYAIVFDRIPWPVNFIFPLSLLVFYSLYNVLMGKEKYILLLSLFAGLAFNMHFTAIFFPIYIILSIPLFPRTKGTLKYIVLGIPLFIIFLVPNIIYEISTHSSTAKSFSGYMKDYNHGFHLVRFLQLKNDALIELESTLYFKITRVIEYLIFPVFIFFLNFKKISRSTIVISYLFSLWFIIPWIIFTLYSGEITNYYFSLTRPFAVIILAYLLSKIFEIKSFIPKIAVTVLLIYYSYLNISTYFSDNINSLSVQRIQTLSKIQAGVKVEFREGVPESYIYYYYTHK